jgi:hypothetical protein
MSKSCVNHKEAPSITMCFQCHKPICKSCTVVTPQGTFCSSECGLLNREFKEKQKEPKAKEPMGKLMVLLQLTAAFVLICLLFVGINAAAKRYPKFKKVDLMGRVIEAVKHARKD